MGKKKRRWKLAKADVSYTPAQEALLASRKAAVERDGSNAVGPERLDLVFHERNER